MHDMRMRAAMLVTSCALTLPILAVADQSADVARIGVTVGSPYGSYLVDASGRPLYMFTSDTEQRSTCYGACARAWPPATTDGTPVAAADSLDAKRLGTIERPSGKLQVTYAGYPLYYYAHDDRGAQPTGQGIHTFGGTWYLLSPSGQAIEKTVKR